MPAAYSEPPDDGISSAIAELAKAQAAAAMAVAKGATLPVATANNPSDVTIGATPTMVAQIGSVQVGAGQRVILSVSVELDVNPPESLGAAGTATLYARYQAGAGPEVVVAQKQEDLILGPSTVTLHNILSFTTMTDVLGNGNFAFDVSVSYTTPGATFVPAGTGRVVAQVVA
jgi:hypothetical protein